MLRKKITSGMNSKKMDAGFLYSRWLTRLQQMPRNMWQTPKMMESFILYELKKPILFSA